MVVANTVFSLRQPSLESWAEWFLACRLQFTFSVSIAIVFLRSAVTGWNGGVGAYQVVAVVTNAFFTIYLEDLVSWTLYFSALLLMYALSINIFVVVGLAVATGGLVFRTDEFKFFVANAIVALVHVYLFGVLAFHAGSLWYAQSYKIHKMYINTCCILNNENVFYA